MKNKLFLIASLLIINGGLISQVPSYVPSEGLVGWWPFNGNAEDESGTGNDGEVYDATLTTDRFLENDRAYSFSGFDYIEVIDDNSLDLTQNFTISAWYLTYDSISYGAILGKGKNESSTGYALLHNVWDINDNELSFNTGISLQNNPDYFTASESFIDPSLITPNTWNHLVSTYDGNELKLFLNGGLVNSINTNIELYDNSTTSLYFGKELVNFRYFYGKIDDIGVWNRALSREEVGKMFNSTPTTTTDVNDNSHPTDFGGKIECYPNPTTDVINVDLSGLNDYSGQKLRIMNLSGQIVYEENVNQSKVVIDVKSLLSSGIYVINTVDQNGNISSTNKFVVQ